MPREDRQRSSGARNRGRQEAPELPAADALKSRKPHLPAADALNKLSDDAFVAALRAEVAAWAWLYALLEKEPNLELRCRAYLDLRRVAEPAVPADVARATTADLVVNQRIVRAASARGEFVRAYAKEQPLVAAAVLASFLGTLGRPVSEEDFEALIVAVLYRKGVYQRAQSEALELARVRDSWKALSQEAGAELERLKVDTQNSVAVGTAKITRLVESEQRGLKKLEELLASCDSKVDSHVQKAETTLATKTDEVASHVDALAKRTEDRLEALRQAYISQVALKAPVSFWQEKREQHDRAAKRHGTFLAFAAPLVTVFLAVLAWLVLPVGEEISIRSIGLFLGISSVAIWFLRVVVRLWLMNVHLETDSRERIVMAQPCAPDGSD